MEARPLVWQPDQRSGLHPSPPTSGARVLYVARWPPAGEGLVEVEQAQVVRIDRHRLVVALAEEFAVVEAVGPGRAAVGGADVNVADEGGLLGFQRRSAASPRRRDGR